MKMTTTNFKTQFNSLVTYFAYQKGLTQNDAEDLAQEIMVKAMDTFQDDRGAMFSTHVFNVSKTMLIDFYRKAKEVKTLSLSMEENSDNAPLQVSDTNFLNGFQTLNREDSNNRVMYQFNLLNDTQRTIMTEFYMNDLKVKEIAEKYAMPLSSVKVNMKRGRDFVFKNYSKK